MKYCTHCGAELLDEAVLCPKCGCWVNDETTPAISLITTATTEVKQKLRLNVCALVGFIFSIVSLAFFVNIFSVISIVGVVLGSVGLSQINSTNNYRGREFAIAGLVVSCCTFVISLIFWLAMIY